MAGRGCTITIKVLGGAADHDQNDDISLPVALHSPLHVLKEELEGIIAIQPHDQVLILCDLSDPDRNSDVLLAGRDDMTLLECGIRNGSVLTLHALGMPAEIRQRKAKLALATTADPPYWENTRLIHSYIPAEAANHSYNGIIFDVESTGPYEVTLESVSIAGMLGRVVGVLRDTIIPSSSS